jgi:hypothetical protein
MPSNEPSPHRISAKDARGGEIILRTRLQRAVFIGGLVLLALFVLIS